MISGDIKLFMPIRASMFEAQISGLKAISEWRHSHDLGSSVLSLRPSIKNKKPRLYLYLELQPAGEACAVLPVMNGVEVPWS